MNATCGCSTAWCGMLCGWNVGSLLEVVVVFVLPRLSQRKEGKSVTLDGVGTKE